MSYQALHIPFASGQDEGYDRKILPIGPMRSIRNMWLERDGRLARRSGLTTKSESYVNGDTVNATDPVRGLTDSGFIAEDDDDTGALYHCLYRNDAAGDERIIQATGRPTRVSSIEKFESSAGTTSSRNDQICPCVDVCYDGTIVFAYLSGTTATLEFRNPVTLEVLSKTQHTIGGGSDTVAYTSTAPSQVTVDYIDRRPPKIKVVASKVSNHIAVISHYVAPANDDDPDTWVMKEEIFNTFGERIDGYGRVLHSAAAEPFGGEFYDAVARPNADSFLCVRRESTSTQLFEVEFQRADGVPPVETLLATVPNPGVAGNTFRVGCSCSETRWYVSTQTAVYSKRFGDTGQYKVAAVPFAEYNTVISAVDIGDDQTKLVWGVLEENYEDIHTTASSDPLLTNSAIWTHADGSVGSLGDTVSCGFEYPMTHAIRTSGQSVSFLAEFGHSYGEPTNVPDSVVLLTPPSTYTVTPVEVTDIAKEPFWSPAHIVESSGVDGKNYVVATALETGSRYFDYDIGNDPYYAPHHDSIWTKRKESAPGRPVSYTAGGRTYTLYPATIFSSGSVSLAEGYPYGQFRAAFFRTTNERIDSIKFRGGSVLAGGIVKHAIGEAIIQGFTGPPAWRWLNYTTDESVGIGGPYTIQFCATLEYRDPDGRLWRSAPSVARTFELPAIESDDYGHVIRAMFECHSGIPLPAKGCRLVLWGTNPDGNIFYRRDEVDIRPGEDHQFHYSIYTDSNEDGEVLYTTGDVLANGCPPSARFLMEHGGRLWAASGTSKNTVQASKTINDTLGVEWNSLDSFKVVLPDEVTGMAPMDSAAVLFTESGVFVVHGTGPDLGGVGSFSEPQQLPCSNGCINHRSVIATNAGVFFQSRRGLEYVPRGFGSPVFAGESVRDTTDAYPHCFGVAQSTYDGTVRWLMGLAESSGGAVVVVFDPRTQAWCTYTYNGQLFKHIRRTGGEITMAGDYVGTIRAEDTSAEAGLLDLAWVETGSLRVTGLQSWAFGRRFHLLGEFGGRPCTVRVRMSFNDEEFLPDDVASWDMTTESYTANAPVELELTLPVQRFSTIRFKIEIQSLSDEEGLGYTYKPNGMTLYYSPASEGPRLQSRNTA
jgi:hypothetical protein